MKDQLNQLILYALKKKASDIHFIYQDDQLKIQLRTMDGMLPIHQDIWKKNLFEYLKFISGFDLTNPFEPQSGQFTWKVQGRTIFCRFSVIFNESIQTGVLRLLTHAKDLKLEQLTYDTEALRCMQTILHLRQGLILTSGPTNSGKTTTIHALLHEIALRSQFKIVSLEDPIEIEDPSYLQLQINESQGFTYERGIEELMRHDPDVIFIGETRNEFCAKSLVNAALTGHMVVSTIHAGSCLEAIERLLDFGVDARDLKSTLMVVMSQRLYKTDSGKKVCVYEIVRKSEIRYILDSFQYPKAHKTLAHKIREGIQQGYIQDEQAQFDLENFER